MADNNVVNTPDNTTEESSVDSKELTRLKAQLRAQAERAVIQRHQDEYHEEAEKLFAEHGLEFSRRLTKTERKAKELEDIIKNHPDIAQRYGLKPEATSSSGGGVADARAHTDDTQFDRPF